jgi:hypothetical protein
MRLTLALSLLGIVLAACTTPSPYERTTREAVQDLEETQPEPAE